MTLSLIPSRVTPPAIRVKTALLYSLSSSSDEVSISWKLGEESVSRELGEGDIFCQVGKAPFSCR